MDVGLVNVIGAAVTAAGAFLTGAYAARSKRSTEDLATKTNKDELVLVHYDKIVDQLQEEVGRLIKENIALGAAKQQLETMVTELSKQVIVLSRQVGELKASLELLQVMKNTEE